MISILDYGSGNVGAFVNLCKEANIDFRVTSDWREVENAEKLIFPGVGAFDPTIDKLVKLGLFDAIRNLALYKRRPILGVCVGMQCLLDSSDEGHSNGLSLIPGYCTKFDTNLIQEKPKIPHMGWNSIASTQNSSLLFDIDLIKGFYFLHSYHASAINEKNVICKSTHNYEFPCIIQNEYTVGVQFHPEKSHRNGELLLKNFDKL
jgi:glutamine amidotransferase